MSLTIKKRSHSFTGCHRCKRRRQKCDEAKPDCTRCSRAGVACCYDQRLRWGGREFTKSRFGMCLQKNDVSKIQIEPGRFIYTPGSAKGSHPPYRLDVIGDIPLGATSLPDMPDEHRFLLHFFQHETSRIISCHDQVWESLRRVVIPMAVESPCLLSAVLTVSANYLLSSGIPSVQKEKYRLLSTKMRDSSIEGLRLALDANSSRTEVTLATAMFLCLFDIHSGIDPTASWRVHFQGARALISALGSTYTISQGENQDRWRSLFAQMYTSIEVIAAITVQGLTREQWSRISHGQRHYIDDYFGMSTQLLGVLCEVGAVASERRRLRRSLGPIANLSEDGFKNEAENLENLVLNMITQEKRLPTPFHARIEQSLSPEQRREYRLCNEAYQYTALIKIYRRIRGLPSSSREVQFAVKGILKVAAGMKHSQGLSPWLLMATPLFTAGSEEISSDRESAKRLLEILRDTIRLTNYQSALDILELHWRKSDEEGVDDVELILEQYDIDFMPW